jgi:ATP-dependent RNA helicase DeaD
VVEISDQSALVEIPAEAADHVIDALRRTKLRGRRVTVRRDHTPGEADGAS